MNTGSSLTGSPGKFRRRSGRLWFRLFGLLIVFGGGFCFGVSAVRRVSMTGPGWLQPLLGLPSASAMLLPAGAPKGGPVSITSPAPQNAQSHTLSGGPANETHRNTDVKQASLAPRRTVAVQSQTKSVGATDAQPIGDVPLTPGEQVAQKALSYVGCRYLWGGSSAKEGFDCSGLVQTVFQECGISVPRNGAEQFKIGTPVTYGELQPGDLVFFRDTYKKGLSHVGIYIGSNRFVNAGDEKAGVAVNEIGPNNRAHWAGGRRLNLAKMQSVQHKTGHTANKPLRKKNNG